MRRRSPVLLALSTWLTVVAACEKQPDLATALKCVPAMTGYTDGGIVNGENRLLPAITFQLKNEGDLPITYVDVMVAFWEVGADGELDSKLVRGIEGTPLDAGQTSESITVASTVGYKSPTPRAEFFINSIFKGFVAKVFAKRRGKTTRLGEFTIEQRLLPAAPKSGTRP